MTRSEPTPAPAQAHATRSLVQVLILVALAIVVFWPDISVITTLGLRDAENAQALVAPLLAFILLWQRRRLLRDELGRGSALGPVVILAGLFLCIALSWPFNFGLLRRLCFVLVVAGAVLSVCGWGVLRRCVPALIVLALAIPLGVRLMAAFTRQPEAITLQVATGLLEVLPGVVAVEMDGSDMKYVTADGPGAIGLGIPNPWMALLQPYLMVVVAFAFMRVRKVSHLVVFALAALPIALLCNFVRVFALGALTIFVSPDPISAVPRVWSTIGTLVLAFLAAACLSLVLRVLTSPAPDTESGATESEATT